MTTVICTCRVADYDAFRPGYDKAMDMFSDQIRSWQLLRGQDDPNLIVMKETFDSREAAERLWTHPNTRAAMEADGIDMETVQIEYLDDVTAGSHQPGPELDLGVPE
jgi:quinol monooxygenase YgiN